MSQTGLFPGLLLHASPLFQQIVRVKAIFITFIYVYVCVLYEGVCV